MIITSLYWLIQALDDDKTLTHQFLKALTALLLFLTITARLQVYYLIRILMAQAATELTKQVREIRFKVLQEMVQIA